MSASYAKRAALLEVLGLLMLFARTFRYLEPKMFSLIAVYDVSSSHKNFNCTRYCLIYIYIYIYIYMCVCVYVCVVILRTIYIYSSFLAAQWLAGLKFLNCYCCPSYLVLSLFMYAFDCSLALAYSIIGILNVIQARKQIVICNFYYYVLTCLALQLFIAAIVYTCYASCSH
jgi:hypothetical protein